MGLLDGDLAQSIFEAFSGTLLTGIYRQPVVPASGALEDRGDPQDHGWTADQAVEGFWDNYSAFSHAQAGIPEKDFKACIFARSMPGVTPAEGDIGRLGTRWFQVRKVAVDPATALWELQSFEIEEPA